jgi:hypothetical protein
VDSSESSASWRFLLGPAASRSLGNAQSQDGLQRSDVSASTAATAKLAPPGRARCRPPSPTLSFGGAPETKGTARRISAWALFFLTARARWIDRHLLKLDGVRSKQLKIAWRMTGRGPLRLLAIGPGGVRVHPLWGPERHGSSTWNRPGAEWGSGFVLRKKGCWQLHASRGASQGNVWLVVAG